MARLSMLIEDILNYVSLAIIAFLMFLTTGEVICRYFFNYPIPGHHEIVELCVPAIAFLGIAHLQRLEGHIRVDVLISKLEGRNRYVAEALLNLLCFIVFVFIAIATFKNTLQAGYSIGEVTENLLIPTWPFRFFITLGSTALCIRFIIQFSQNFAKIAELKK